MAVLSEICPPDVWADIVRKTVDDAKDGDAKARDWLASYLVGKPAGEADTLHALAVEEVAGDDPVAREAFLRGMLDGLG